MSSPIRNMGHIAHWIDKKSELLELLDESLELDRPDLTDKIVDEYVFYKEHYENKMGEKLPNDLPYSVRMGWYKRDDRVIRPDQMTAAKAYAFFGVSEDADRDEILRAYSRLNRILHPARGGTEYLITELNKAKRALLGDSA